MCASGVSYECVVPTTKRREARVATRVSTVRRRARYALSFERRLGFPACRGARLQQEKKSDKFTFNLCVSLTRVRTNRVPNSHCTRGSLCIATQEPFTVTGFTCAVVRRSLDVIDGDSRRLGHHFQRRANPRTNVPLRDSDGDFVFTCFARNPHRTRRHKREVGVDVPWRGALQVRLGGSTRARRFADGPRRSGTPLE